MTTADSGRDAILRAARIAFARDPFALVTLRDIATEAGVSAALIVKHFGSKESLFDRVADFGAAAESLLDAPDAELGHHLVLTLIRYRRAHRLDLLLRVVFTIGRGDERSLLRERFQAQVVRRLAERLRGPDAQLRAEMVVGQLLGLSAASAINPGGPVSTVDPERIAKRYGPGIQSLIDE
ncbi:MAG TPA: TetR family transcriptional regulator [Stackebrandtia sp.]|jgi:AcrR family transcriptional regulator|uniref:TetR/AcrR family transcriptional regulator n=1 Tax=Stackebrandtia sp. TaxID=2023065 RepID=UPI002D5DC26F|nr:TetR family transcriptional regulator [Stackebrandtia sp.]HZE37741.1 TetR family transcriptional regulator [Stackebrandtia sp.]